ncbi:MAG TPA: cytochrome c3 family protein [Gemmatimonadaceae bacterium]|nr:cytochrome c3 family protein [Gemmatimonadaceae bacterium]
MRRALRFVVLLLGFVAGPGLGAQQAGFPHERHAQLFPLCTTCHAGVVDGTGSVFPDAARCATCHDGTVQRRVTWQARAGPRANNLRFDHATHTTAVLAHRASDTTLSGDCSACHVEGSAHRMSVRPAVLAQCYSCHETPGVHVDAPNDACARCHVKLTDARLLAPAAIATFPKPASHADPSFKTGGHGKLAKTATGGGAIASSCATCHSRDMCITCHVDAPESRPIQALALDARAPRYAGKEPVPASHADRNFSRAHAGLATKPGATCATCHTRESCETCHLNVPPTPVLALAAAGTGRAVGAHVERTKPVSHGWDFPKRHSVEANARPQQCETCHTRETCLTCHRPENARQSAFHGAGFLTKHPSAAFSREARCTDCHNTAQFCQSCHQKSGLTAAGRIGKTGYHDAFRGFSLGHGKAARQNLETCAGCHAERDCTACHSVLGGFGFSPHGPGFNANRLKSKNPSFCVACHGPGIVGKD